jgi:hypothetical protein
MGMSLMRFFGIQTETASTESVNISAALESWNSLTEPEKKEMLHEILSCHLALEQKEKSVPSYRDYQDALNSYRTMSQYCKLAIVAGSGILLLKLALYLEFFLIFLLERVSSRYEVSPAKPMSKEEALSPQGYGYMFLNLTQVAALGVGSALTIAGYSQYRYVRTWDAYDRDMNSQEGTRYITDPEEKQKIVGLCTKLKADKQYSVRQLQKFFLEFVKTVKPEIGSARFENTRGVKR